MAQTDILKRYLDAGLAFTQVIRERAEEFVQELVKAGEVRRKEAQENIEQVLEWSRRNSEELVALIRREVADQIRSLGLEDLAKRAGVTLPDKPKAASTPKPAPTAAAATAAPAPAKKAAAKKSAAKKSATKATKKTAGAKKAAKKSS